jgi:hypothetical protein
MKKLFLGLMMFSMVSAVVAQPEAPPSRSMSLVDCVQEALLHNLDLQIERYSPELSKLALQGN